MSGNNIAEEIKNRCNIIDVVGRYVQLKRSGNNYKGLCPFHSEKTPSFSVSESRQFFYCFGCGASGDVITFLMKIENIDFLAAATKLAEEYGIELEKFGYRNEEKKNALFEMNREAALFYFKNLTEKPNAGYEYMKRRGLDTKTITKFGIGYAKDDWHGLENHLLSKGYTEEQMVEAGLISRSKGRTFDKFRNRVMFPIFNTRGKVIGFGGRTLGEDGPKYLNSPESSVFSKKNNLFGLNLTRQEISSRNCAILVEGYMDLVSLYRHGIKNTAASLGTALTEQQCLLLKRYTENVILAYDSDAAGRNAALRGIELLKNAGLSAKVFHVTEGKDPDEFVSKNGRQAFLKLADQALPYADYRIAAVREKYDISTPEGSIGFLRELKPILAGLSPVEADVYIKKTSHDTGISEGAIRREINEADGDGFGGFSGFESDNGRRYGYGLAGQRGGQQEWNRSGRRTGVQDAADVPVSGDQMIQMYFIKLASVDPDYIRQIRDYEFVFEDPAYQRIYQTIKNICQEDATADINKVSDSLLPEDQALFQDALQRVVFSEDSDQVFRKCVEAIKAGQLKKRQEEILNVLTLLSDDESEGERAEALTKELMELQKMMQSIRL